MLHEQKRRISAVRCVQVCLDEKSFMKPKLLLTTGNINFTRAISEHYTSQFVSVFAVFISKSLIHSPTDSVVLSSPFVAALVCFTHFVNN